jgi:hypothetical protein
MAKTIPSVRRKAEPNGADRSRQLHYFTGTLRLQVAQNQNLGSGSNQFEQLERPRVHQARSGLAKR